jgi:hypothetical protein
LFRRTTTTRFDIKYISTYIYVKNIMENFSESLKKALSVLMPREFPFVDGVKNVIATGNEFNRSVKFKVILNKDWITKNFPKDSLDYLGEEYEEWGEVLLSPYSLEEMSGGKIRSKTLDEFIETILTMLGFGGRALSSFNISYIIE